MIDSKDLDLFSLQNENQEATLSLSVNTLRCNTREGKKSTRNKVQERIGLNESQESLGWIMRKSEIVRKWESELARGIFAGRWEMRHKCFLCTVQQETAL